MVHIRKKILVLCLLSLWMPMQGTLVSYAQDRLLPYTDEDIQDPEYDSELNYATIIGTGTLGNSNGNFYKVNKTDPNGANYNPSYNPDYYGESVGKAGSVVVGYSAYSGAIWGTVLGDSCGVMSKRGLALAHGAYVGLNAEAGIALGAETYVGDNAVGAVAIGVNSQAYEKILFLSVMLIYSDA